MKPHLQSGFTLTELLVVLAIIGILSALGIIQYSTYRTSAFNKVANADLRNAISAQEATFLDRERYWDCMNEGCNDPVVIGFKKSPGVSIACTPRDDGKIFQCSTRHSKGNVTYYYDSENSTFWEM